MPVPLWSRSLRTFIQFLAHAFEEIGLRLRRIFADLTGLRQAEGGNPMRGKVALVVHPRDQLAALRALTVAELVILMNQRNVIC
jgi:hypothetical protein